MFSEYMSRALALEKSVRCHVDLSTQVAHDRHSGAFQEINLKILDCIREQSAWELFWA
jgi:hypothetical protein